MGMLFEAVHGMDGCTLEFVGITVRDWVTR